MSLQEVQTAAARVIHVDRLSDAASKELQVRVGYHPLDIESLFSVATEPSFSVYGNYALMTWLWPDTTTQETSEFRFFIDAQHLTVIGDTAQRDIRSYLEQLHHQLGAYDSQLSAPELIHEILQRLRQPWSESSARPTSITQQLLTANAQVTRQLGRWLQTSNLPTAVPSLIIDAHFLDSLADRPLLVAPPNRTPMSFDKPLNLLRTYTIASAAMVVMVLAVLTIT